MSYESFVVVYSRMERVWSDQCRECGKRFPNTTSLNRHVKRVHGPRLKCNFCWWSCQSHQRQRLVEHERAHHSMEGFVPAETPAFSGSLASVVVPVQPVTTTVYSSPLLPLMSSVAPVLPLTPIVPLTPEITEKNLESSMPDFADLLRIEPATPSPLKRLRANSPSPPPPPPLVTIPSD